MADRTPSVPGKSKSLRYPEDIKDQKTDYVLFEFGKYTPPFSGGQGANLKMTPEVSTILTVDQKLSIRKV